MNQPYLLLCLTSLFWAGNIVVGRYVAGQIPPMTLSFVRWLAPLQSYCRLHGKSSSRNSR